MTHVAPISGPTKLDGQTALVTGAAGGIGRAVCLALAREGADVACCDLAPPEQVATEVADMGRRSLALDGDLAQESTARAWTSQVLDAWGRIDILVNSAGVLGDSDTPMGELSAHEWDRIIDINLRGCFLMTQAVWDHMSVQGSGKIVCLGSIAGRIGGVLAGPHYCASKGGIHAFVKWAAKNGAPLGIRCNGIAPGPIQTPMIKGKGYRDDMAPLGRLGEPEDIAEAALFLASQASNYITGNVLDVNGGMLMV